LKPLRIAHISDTHLGYRAHSRLDHRGRNMRSADIESAYARAIDSILENGPFDVVLHTGDVFHHSRPGWAAVVSFIAQTKRLEAAGCPVIVIAGNHDTSQLRTSETVFSVLSLSLPAVTFATGFTESVITLDDLGLVITAVPHGALENREILPPESPADYRSILMTHGLAPTFAESPRHEIGETLLSTELVGGTWDVVLLGHFHRADKVSANAWYAGATERIGWNDVETDPGWSIVTIAADGTIDVERVPVAGRAMHQVVVRDPGDKTAREIADEVLDLARRTAPEGAMVRADLTGVDRAIRRSAEAMLRRDAADSYFWIQTYARSEASAEQDDDRRLDDHEPMQGLDDLFAEFCTREIDDAPYRDRLRERGSAALTAALALAESSAGANE
jgi:exonuclease SbcD